MCCRFGVLVCPHAGGVGLCEHVIHLRWVPAVDWGGMRPAEQESAFCSLIDYIAISGSMEENVIEYAKHLHEHFVYPCSINEQGRYIVPENEQEGYR